MSRFRRSGPLVALSLVLAACAADPPDTRPATTPTASTRAESSTTQTTPARVTSTTASTSSSTSKTTPAGPPPGIVSASTFQYRLDWAAGLFQVRLSNDSADPVGIAGVQMVWDGFTTPVTERSDTIVPGLALDFPVRFAGADCAGDGLQGDMPSLDDAVVRLTLKDGSTRDVPVYDVDGVAQRLYLDDCERQMIESQVTIEWADLHDEPLDGRIVTGGVLRLVRQRSTEEVTLLSISNTVLYVVETVDTGSDEPIATLAVGDDEVSARIRITENRCDAHARAESSQSFRFFGQVDLGNGDVHEYTILPTPDDQLKIRARLEAGCAILEDTGFLGGPD